jgi:predicted permease
MMRDFVADLRYGARALRRSWGFTALVVLSLGLGIGANGAIFSLADALFFRPLPVRQPSQLVILSDPSQSGVSDGLPRGQLDMFSPGLFQRLAEQDGRPAFAGLAAQDSGVAQAFVQAHRRAEPAPTERALGKGVSARYFDVLGVAPQRGRTFRTEDEVRGPDGDAVVVLAHAYWQRRFGGDPRIIGERLTVDRTPATVVGIAPPSFRGIDVGVPLDFWFPLPREAPRPPDVRRDNRSLLVFGRLADAVPPAAAEAAANVAFQRYLADDPALAGDAQARQAVRIVLSPGEQGVSRLRDDFRGPLAALAAGVAVLLLIVCLNVSHLLLARAIRRQREMGIRTALGATRGRLIRQLLAEGLLLAGMGGAVGLLASRWLSDGLLLLATSGTTLDLPEALDGRLLGVVAVLTLAAALVLGLVPAWQGSAAGIAQALRATSSSVSAGGGRRLGSRVLLTSQVACSLVLLVGAGLLAGSLARVRLSPKGFDEDSVLTVTLSRNLLDLNPQQTGDLNRDLVARMAAVPGVVSASASDLGPLGAGRAVEIIQIPGSTRTERLRLATVTAGYFRTVGMTLLRAGRLDSWDQPGGPRRAVINETIARRMFGGLDVVGRQFRFDPMLSPSQRPDPIEVVGVVKDAINTGPREPAEAMAYLSPRLPPSFAGNLQLRVAGDPARLEGAIRRAVQEAHPGLRVTALRTMRAQVERMLVQEKLLATLSITFGLAALFLVSLGLYGVISQWAGQRTREIGVRLALGATGAGLRWLVLRQALLLALAGVAIGIPAALSASRLLQGLLFGLQPTHAPTFVLAAVLMLAVAALAAYLPARRASRLDPIAALRSE